MAEQVIDCLSVDHWKEQFETAKTSGKLVVVDFTATWCGPCRMIAPYVAELAKEHANVVFLKVDVDTLGPIAKEYKINAMPSFVFLKNGVEIDRFLGAKKDTLANLVVKHSTASSAI